VLSQGGDRSLDVCRTQRLERGVEFRFSSRCHQPSRNAGIVTAIHPLTDRTMLPGASPAPSIQEWEPRMNCKKMLFSGVVALVAVVTLDAAAQAVTDVQIGASGKTFASAVVQCATHPDTDRMLPVVDAGLFNPKRAASAAVSVNGAFVATVTTVDPVAEVWLAEGDNTVVVALGKKTADSYVFTVSPYECTLPDTSGNTFSADGTLEYAASGKSYATVTPGCALNASTGQAQPYVHLFDNGSYLLNVSVDGVPLTQLSTYNRHTPVFLSAGQNVISAANGSLSVDYYVRDGGDGRCVLSP
jgi:hypothetical protein